MNYNFDEIIDRRHTNATSVEGFKRNLLGDPDFPLPCPDDEAIRLWVADMEFAAPDCILKAVKTQLRRDVTPPVLHYQLPPTVAGIQHFKPRRTK